MDTNPATEVTSPEAQLEALILREEQGSVETPAEQTQTETTTEEVPADQPEVVEEETEELEVGEFRFALPKTAAEKLKAERLMHADYTRKTQEIADARKTFDERQEHFALTEKARALVFEKAVDAGALARQLKQYEALDWDALYQQDPAEAARLDRQARALQQQHAQLVGEVNQAQAQAQQLTETTRQQRLKWLGEEAQKAIPGYTADVDKAVFQTAQELGAPPHLLQWLGDVGEPWMLKVLHLAHRASALDKSKALTEKKLVNAKPVSVPAARTATTSAQVLKVQEATGRLKQSGKEADAVAALMHLSEHKRKR